MIIFSLACFLAIFLFIVFEQNTLFEYGKFLKLKLPYESEYENILESGGTAHYVNFLRGIYKNNFWVQGLTCPVCLSVWLSLILSIVSFNLLSYPIINFVGLIGFFLLNNLKQK